jgi:3-oxoacyl-[acyl-carrier-protein] synthase II
VPERIAVTGVGIVSALGHDARSTFDRLVAGDRGFGPVTLFDVSDQKTGAAAEIRGLRVADVAPFGEAESWSRSDALAVLAAREALGQAALERVEHALSVAVGATTGGMFEAETVLASLDAAAATQASARRLLSYPLSTTAERIAQVFGPVERAVTVTSACSSGANAIVCGAAWLASGVADRVLAGGTDGLCRLTFTGFNALGAVDPEACRPFDRRRAGLTLGEGAAFVVLERESTARARGARVLAWLSGWAAGAEAHHITQPEPSGERAARWVRAALERAGLGPSGVDYVNAHGTGTVHNDAMEARALEAVLGREVARVWVSSAKGQLGHTLGAAGAVEAAITVLALERGVVPPTGGLEDPDPALPLRHVVGAGRSAALRAALSNSFGFGGAGAVLAFEHASAPARAAPERARPRLVITGTARAAGDACDPRSELDPARSRRFDRTTALVCTGAERALGAARLAPEGVGLVHGNAFGNVERSVEFIRRIRERGARLAAPAEFPHLVPSAPSGNASIYLGLTGPVLGVSDLGTSAEAAFCSAANLVELGVADQMITGGAEARDAIVARVLGPLCSDGDVARTEAASWLVVENSEAAARRGARVLALVRQWSSTWGTPERALDGLAAPRDASRARVFWAAPSVALERALGACAWHGVVRRSPNELAPGEALVAACEALERGDVDEALVLGAARSRAYAVLLARAESSS